MRINLTTKQSASTNLYHTSTNISISHPLQSSRSVRWHSSSLSATGSRYHNHQQLCNTDEQHYASQMLSLPHVVLALLLIARVPWHLAGLLLSWCSLDPLHLRTLNTQPGDVGTLHQHHFAELQSPSCQPVTMMFCSGRSQATVSEIQNVNLRK